MDNSKGFNNMLFGDVGVLISGQTNLLEKLPTLSTMEDRVWVFGFWKNKKVLDMVIRLLGLTVNQKI